MPKFAKPRFEEEFLALTEKVGHRQPTLFERRVLPFTFGGRDLAFEVPRGEDITDALAFSAITYRDLPGEGLVSLLLTATPESVRKLGRRLRTFTSNRGKAPHTVAVGIDDNIKKELQLLSRPPDIIVGTPERLIDHIRRDNLTVEKVKRVVIDLPEDYRQSGFDKDLLYIYSKLAKRRQTVLFCPALEVPLPSLLRHPQVVSARDMLPPPIPHLVYRTENEESKAELLCDIFHAEEVFDGAVICRSRSTADRLVSQLASQGITARQLSKDVSAEERKECVNALRAGAIRAVVSDAMQSIIGMPLLKKLIFYEMPPDVGSYDELKALATQIASCSALITIAAMSEPNILEGTQEVQYVDMSNNPSSEDILKGKIRSIVKHIKEEEDPEDLNRLRKIVRRNVPIFLRGYFMAYLLKESGGKSSVAQDMKTLFVSIGKNRRVFPRDLSRLFSGALEIKASSIGNIKVLDNYSFIDVPEPLAERAITMLDGKDFRGRKITVNHARKKEEE